MNLIIGSGYLGSPTMLSATPSHDIIQPHKPSGYESFSVYKFSFMNESACTVVINGLSPIYLKANQGFSSDYYDAPIHTFTIQTDGILYNYIGAY